MSTAIFVRLVASLSVEECCFSRDYSSSPLLDIRQIVISEAPLNGAKSFTINFSIGIDEVIERLSTLLRLKDQIATNAELDAVLIMSAEEVLAFRRVLSRFRGINGHPTDPLSIELGPTVI